MITLKMSTGLGRPVRADDVSTLGHSTYKALLTAIRVAQWAQAAELAPYFFQELRLMTDIYTTWCGDMERFLRDKHGEDDRRRFIERTTSPWYKAIHRERAGLEAQDLFNRLLDHETTNALYGSALPDLLAAIESHDAAAAQEHAETLRLRGKLYQDIFTDWCWAIMTYVGKTYGEEEVAALNRDTLVPWYKARYDRYFALPEEERLQLTVEGMRGHLCGPGRLGDVEVIDEGNRWVMSFDPCGSGGRMRRGDATNADPPHTDAPYNFGVSQKAYDWTWGRSGVCYYCAHCAFVNEQLGIDTYGHPIRITDYPDSRDQPCRWIIYKNVDDIPEEYYTRVGRSKPGRAAR